MQESTFRESLRALRKSRGYSVRKAALNAGVSSSFYSQLENNKRDIPKLTTLVKIAHGLRVPEAQILKIAGILPNATDQLAPDTTVVHFTNTNRKLIFPMQPDIEIKIVSLAENSTLQDYVWLVASDSSMQNLGILKNDLAVVRTKQVTQQLKVGHNVIVAVNYPNSKSTVIRQALNVDDNRIVLTSNQANDEPFIIPKSSIDIYLAGIIVGVYRTI